MSRPNGIEALLGIQKRTVEVMDRVRTEAGIEMSEVTRVAFMNFSREMVQHRAMGILGLPMSRSTWEYGRTIGHVGASDQILSFDNLLTTGQLGPGDHLLMAGIGPGVTLSCAIVKVLSSPPWIGPPTTPLNTNKG
jgi:3-oxoacyl-[acyl-carrier-protein] synthase-3/clorobiocin biosynthesis protein CloN2